MTWTSLGIGLSSSKWVQERGWAAGDTGRPGNVGPEGLGLLGQGLERGPGDGLPALTSVRERVPAGVWGPGWSSPYNLSRSQRFVPSPRPPPRPGSLSGLGAPSLHPRVPVHPGGTKGQHRVREPGPAPVAILGLPKVSMPGLNNQENN